MNFFTDSIPHPDAANNAVLPIQDGVPADVTGNVYLASPLSTYHTPRYDHMCDRVRKLFPLAALVPARDCGFTRTTWLPRWQVMLPTLAAVVVFTDDAEWIGKGVWTEITTARITGIPVWFLTDDEVLHRLENLTFTVDEDDWKQYAHVALAPVGVA